MKIKIIKKPFDEVKNIAKPKHVLPKRPSYIFRALSRVYGIIDLFKAKFSFSGIIDKKGGPYFILMNHSSFIDIKIAHKLFYPMPFFIICTHDALVGKAWFMRKVGCIPTKKFVSDLRLIGDIKHALDKEKTSVLMFPEAGYSFDGRATALPENFGRLVKRLGVPVLFVETKGAFTRDPLYNGLRIRKVPVSANVTTLFSKDEIERLDAKQISDRINEAFSFDNFKWQREEGIKVNEPFRAEGLERILYRCAHCSKEGHMVSNGEKLTCTACGKTYTLTELGSLQADDGDTEFSHIPDWYDWQRKCVREQILKGEYYLETPVEIAVMCDYKALYKVGNGILRHGINGFNLSGCDGQLEYEQSAKTSFGLNADYFWYEIGDVICIGNSDRLYYCFPPKGVSVTKARLATEELYKLYKEDEKFFR